MQKENRRAKSAFLHNIRNKAEKQDQGRKNLTRPYSRIESLKMQLQWVNPNFGIKMGTSELQEIGEKKKLMNDQLLIFRKSLNILKSKIFQTQKEGRK